MPYDTRIPPNDNVRQHANRNQQVVNRPGTAVASQLMQSLSPPQTETTASESKRRRHSDTNVVVHQDCSIGPTLSRVTDLQIKHLKGYLLDDVQKRLPWLAEAWGIDVMEALAQYREKLFEGLRGVLDQAFEGLNDDSTSDNKNPTANTGRPHSHSGRISTETATTASISGSGKHNDPLEMFSSQDPDEARLLHYIEHSLPKECPGHRKQRFRNDKVRAICPNEKCEHWYDSCGWFRHVELRNPDHFWLCSKCDEISERPDRFRTHLKDDHSMSEDQAKEVEKKRQFKVPFSSPCGITGCDYTSNEGRDWNRHVFGHLKGDKGTSEKAKWDYKKVPFPPKLQRNGTASTSSCRGNSQAVSRDGDDDDDDDDGPDAGSGPSTGSSESHQRS